jgi:SAM-dependent methyltransferase
LILRDASWETAAHNEEFGMLARRLDNDELGLALLRETPVFHRDAERALTKVRRWLLLSGVWQGYRRLVDAFAVQTTLNGGAWPFDEVERVLLDHASGLPIVADYVAARNPALTLRSDNEADTVARSVVEDYERWPYPVWQRVMAPKRKRLPDAIRALDPDGPSCLPIDAKILIAGCGTGRDAVMRALEFPDATITAIDVSETSLRYARRQSAALGIRNIRLLNLDLHNISELNERFDAIYCSGVLHHLPSPENGWATLANGLREGGVMKIMVYSRVARLRIAAARTLIGDFAPEQINDDMLRRVRQRFMDRPDFWPIRHIIDSDDFSTLAGTRDLLLHRHEDPFDISRISRALDRLELRLLSFSLPTPDAYTRYNATFPHDPMHRDLDAWAKFEKSEPMIFSGMYEFWCRSGANSV